MRILSKNPKEGEVKVRITSNEDLWYLSHVIEESDRIKGQTERKIKVGSDENAKVVRKPVFLKIEATKTEYAPETNSLRILGKITEGPDDISIGSHHSFSLQINDEITIQKKHWPRYLISKLEEAVKEKSHIIIVLFDREEALFATLKSSGFEKLSEMKGDVSKKGDETQKKESFYEEIAKQVEEYVARFKADKIVVASPAFWKEYLLAALSPELRKKTLTAVVSSVTMSALDELMKRDELKKALEDERTADEIKAIDDILNAIRNDKAAYGWKETKDAIQNGAISILVVTENFLKDSKTKGRYREVDEALQIAEDTNAIIKIISGKESSKRLDGLGGIAGVLRWKA